MLIFMYVCMGIFFFYSWQTFLTSTSYSEWGEEWKKWWPAVTSTLLHHTAGGKWGDPSGGGCGGEQQCGCWQWNRRRGRRNRWGEGGARGRAPPSETHLPPHQCVPAGDSLLVHCHQYCHDGECFGVSQSVCWCVFKCVLVCLDLPVIWWFLQVNR